MWKSTCDPPKEKKTTAVHFNLPSFHTNQEITNITQPMRRMYKEIHIVLILCPALATEIMHTRLEDNRTLLNVLRSVVECFRSLRTMGKCTRRHFFLISVKWILNNYCILLCRPCTRWCRTLSSYLQQFCLGLSSGQIITSNHFVRCLTRFNGPAYSGNNKNR